MASIYASIEFIGTIELATPASASPSHAPFAARAAFWAHTGDRTHAGYWTEVSRIRTHGRGLEMICKTRSRRFPRTACRRVESGCLLLAEGLHLPYARLRLLHSDRLNKEFVRAMRECSASASTRSSCILPGARTRKSSDLCRFVSPGGASRARSFRMRSASSTREPECRSALRTLLILRASSASVYVTDSNVGRGPEEVVARSRRSADGRALPVQLERKAKRH